MQPLLARRHWIAIIAITGLCIATLCAARLWFSNTRYEGLQLLPLPQPLVEFQLYGSGGASFTQRDLRGQWHLVFFGFSHCVDVCPVELDVMARVLKKFYGAGPVSPPISGVFVSLDPERDSQVVIDEYLAGFNRGTDGEQDATREKNIVIAGARGNHAELVKLMRFFGADYNRTLQLNGATLNFPAGYALPLGVEVSNEHDYQLNHSARIYLVNSGGQYIGSFPPPHKPDIMIRDLQMILKR